MSSTVVTGLRGGKDVTVKRKLKKTNKQKKLFFIVPEIKMDDIQAITPEFHWTTL